MLRNAGKQYQNKSSNERRVRVRVFPNASTSTCGVAFRTLCWYAYARSHLILQQLARYRINLNMHGPGPNNCVYCYCYNMLCGRGAALLFMPCHCLFSDACVFLVSCLSHRQFVSLLSRSSLFVSACRTSRTRFFFAC
jgi:hypothetical protein